MLSKLIIIGLMSTGLVGTSLPLIENNTIEPAKIVPSGFEISMGALRVNAGHGKTWRAHLSDHSRFVVRLDWRGERSLIIKL